MFSKDQLSASLRATELLTPALRATVIMDQEQLNSDILSALPDDPLYKAHLADPRDCWSVTPDGFLRYDNLIYVPDTNDLRLRILRYKHDHILSGNPRVRTKRQNSFVVNTLGLVFVNSPRSISSLVLRA